MSLNVIKEQFKPHPEIIHSGWKPYINISDSGFHPAFLGCKICKADIKCDYRNYLLQRTEHIPGHWRKDEKRFDIAIKPSFDIRDQHQISDSFYKTGFHVFNTSNDAEAYCKFEGTPELVREIGGITLQFMKVDYTDIIVKGTYQQIEVIIARQVKICDIPSKYDKPYYHHWLD